MPFGLVRALSEGVKHHGLKLAVCSLLSILLIIPACAEDAVSSGTAASGTATSKAVTSIKSDELALAPSAVLSTEAGTVQPLGVEPVHSAAILVSQEESKPSRAAMRTWQALVIGQHAAAVFDAWSTRQALISGNGYERDPLMKPFANSATIYPATQVAPALFDFLAYRMMRSRNPYLRRTWWLPQAASFAGSMWCGSRNLRVANLKH
jgi:hypothetical protein